MEQTIKPLVLCGKPFGAELIEQLNTIRTDDPVISKKEQARQVCEYLGWYSPNGTAAISSASVAINKLQRRGLLTGPQSPASAPKPPRRLRRSEDPLPPIKGLPTKAGEVKGLYFHLVVDCHDPLHPLWNDLIIDQHPSGATPGRVLRQLREPGPGQGRLWVDRAVRQAPISMESLLKPHKEAALSRMAGEAVVLLPQDTGALNFTGLKKTTGPGPLGDEPGAKGRGPWLHSMLAYRPDGVPPGVLDARCRARQEAASRQDRRGRNAKSIDEKESARWLDALHLAAEAARRIPATRLVNITDREGDLYELHDCIGEAPANLHNLIRAQHDRNLEGHNKPWAFMAGQACGATDTIEVPRRRGQKARKATVQIRWSPITIEAPKVGAKKNRPPLSLWAVWLCEPDPPAGVEPLQWMLLTDMPIANAQEAWEKVRWYRCRWGIEEWHRVIKSGCRAEAREFKSAEHLKRVLAFDLIVAWRILACVKLGHTPPQLPATVICTAEELEVLWAAQKKRPTSPCADHPAGQPYGRHARWLRRPQRRQTTRCRKPRHRVAPTHGPGLGLEPPQSTPAKSGKPTLRVRCRARHRFGKGRRQPTAA